MITKVLKVDKELKVEVLTKEINWEEDKKQIHIIVMNAFI